MRVMFAASPAIAIPSLEAISRQEEIEIAAVLTSPDSPRGRSGKPVPSEICEAAEAVLKQYQETGKQAFPILKPLKLDSPLRAQTAETKPDLLVSFAYGRFFGPKFMELFPLGGINIHPSLLPKYRGPSPIQAAILNRDKETGISIQTLSQEMDGGDILAREEIKLTGMETTGSLSELAAQKAARILPEVLKKIAAKDARAEAQNAAFASYCPLVSMEDALIDWKTGALQIEAKVRAFDPWPLCRTIHKGKELLLLKASVHKEKGAEKEPGLVLGTDKKDGILIQTGEGVLAVTRLQYQAKKALFWRDFLNGARDFIGSKLG